MSKRTRANLESNFTFSQSNPPPPPIKSKSNPTKQTHLLATKHKQQVTKNSNKNSMVFGFGADPMASFLLPQIQRNRFTPPTLTPPKWCRQTPLFLPLRPLRPHVARTRRRYHIWDSREVKWIGLRGGDWIGWGRGGGGGGGVRFEDWVAGAKVKLVLGLVRWVGLGAELIPLGRVKGNGGIGGGVVGSGGESSEEDEVASLRLSWEKMKAKGRAVSERR